MASRVSSQDSSTSSTSPPLHLSYACTLTCTSSLSLLHSTALTSCLFWAGLQIHHRSRRAILPNYLPDPSSLPTPHLVGQTCPWLHLPHWPRPHTSPCTSLTHCTCLTQPGWAGAGAAAAAAGAFPEAARAGGSYRPGLADRAHTAMCWRCHPAARDALSERKRI